MTVDFMRFVDRRIGIPLCYLLSGVHRIKSFFKPPARPAAIKRILFMQISEMGSAISAYSAIKKARQLYPRAELYYFIFSEMQESVHLLDCIPRDRVFTVTSKSFFGFAFGLVRMIGTIRKHNFDVILDLELFSRLSSLLSYLFKSKIRVGFYRFHMEGLYRGTFHTHKVIYNHLRHVSYNFLSLVYAISAEIGTEPCTKLFIPDSDIQIKKIRSGTAEKNELLKRLRNRYPGLSDRHRIIIFNPNASELLPLRRWPLDNYCELAKKILKDKSAVIVITGVLSEMKDAEAICSEVRNERCINFAGETTLRQLIDLYNIGHVLLSNDSGPPNFASLTDIHGLVFFGPETPVCYKPLGKNIEPLYANFLCSPCVSAYNHRKSACTKNECLRAIRVDDVHKKIMQLLKHR